MERPRMPADKVMRRHQVETFYSRLRTGPPEELLHKEYIVMTRTKIGPEFDGTPSAPMEAAMETMLRSPHVWKDGDHIYMSYDLWQGIGIPIKCYVGLSTSIGCWYPRRDFCCLFRSLR